MKTRKILFASLLLAGVLNVSGLEVTTDQSGFLSQQITNPEEIKELKLSGPVDAADLYYIGLNMINLESLDLSDATICLVIGGSVAASYPEGFIPEGVFSGLPLNNIVFPKEQRVTIGESAFMNTGFTTIELPATVDSVSNGAYAGCLNLTTITLPSLKMGQYVFASCPNLTTVNIGEVTSIPVGTFRDCKALTTVNGAENLVTIGSNAFEGDISLAKFNFGKNLTHIGESAFAGTALTEVDLSETQLDMVSPMAFAETQLKNVTLPERINEIGSSAFFGNNKIVEFTLPANTIVIGPHAFVGTSLGGIDLYETSLEEIGDYALAGQVHVKELYLPSTLIYIGNNAMEGMTGLEKINATALHSVPELGENVWKGVNQSDVELTVDMPGDDTYIIMFSNADQWKEFKVTGLDVGVDDITSDTPAETGVRGRFVGTELQIESNGPEIDIVRVFDAAGRLLIAVEPRNYEVAVDTSDYPSGIFIVNVILDDKTPATLKLGRR